MSLNITSSHIKHIPTAHLYPPQLGIHGLRFWFAYVAKLWKDEQRLRRDQKRNRSN